MVEAVALTLGLAALYFIGWSRGRQAGLGELDGEWLRWLADHPSTPPASAEGWYTHPRGERGWWWWSEGSFPVPIGEAGAQGSDSTRSVRDHLMVDQIDPESWQQEDASHPHA